MDEFIKLEWDKEYWLATTENPPIYGTGGTPQKALDDYRDSLEELKDELRDVPDIQLNGYWKKVKEMICT